MPSGWLAPRETWPGITAGRKPARRHRYGACGPGHSLIHGRDFVTPDDVKTVALPALRHRVTLAPELEIEGQSTDAGAQSDAEQGGGAANLVAVTRDW